MENQKSILQQIEELKSIKEFDNDESIQIIKKLFSNTKLKDSYLLDTKENLSWIFENIYKHSFFCNDSKVIQNIRIVIYEYNIQKILYFHDKMFNHNVILKPYQCQIIYQCFDFLSNKLYIKDSIEFDIFQKLLKVFHKVIQQFYQSDQYKYDGRLMVKKKDKEIAYLDLFSTHDNNQPLEIDISPKKDNVKKSKK